MSPDQFERLTKKLSYGGNTPRDEFFIAKRLLLQLHFDIKHTRQNLRLFNRLLKKYEAAPASVRLLHIQFANGARQRLQTQENILLNYKALHDCLEGILCNAMRNERIVSTWHDVAQYLGISHIAMEKFIVEWEGFLGNPNLFEAALLHAEVVGEPKKTYIAETNARPIVLFETARNGMMRAVKSNPPMQYQIDKEISAMLGIPHPEPVRNFKLVQS